MDGTLLSSNACMLDESIYRLNRMICDGLMFTFVTARDWLSSREIMSEVNLTLPVSVCNGRAVVDFQTGKMQKGYYIKSDKVMKIIQTAYQYSLFPNISVYHQGRIQTCYVAVHQRSNRDYYLNRLKMKESMTFQVPSINEAITENVISIAFVDSRDKIRKFCAAFDYKNQESLSIHVYNDPFDKTIEIVDILSDTASKGVAASDIANLCGIFAKEQIVSFGNDENDIELLKASGTGVAVGDNLGLLAEYTAICLNYQEGLSVLDFLEQHFYNKNYERKVVIQK
ncbi:HAD-IIB family hydrolase [Ruminiclostridium cellulolyticum]|uniref:HAD-IIB family hydrolase n=1 Tax=Ruminiclostridium cellulolyticum TaxID=1521 RepID=UPI0005A2DE49|nr:HAD-IIB family hydrolase [Ruminiclostridium cellulolyticum]